MTWTASSTESMLSYTKDFISDVTPLLIPIIAILLGLIIFSVVMRSIRGD